MIRRQEDEPDPQDQALLNRNSPEFRAYTDELYRRMPTMARLAALIAPGQPGSVEWLGRIGRFWWEAREETGLSRTEVAKRMNIDINTVRFVEFGYGYPELGLVSPEGRINPTSIAESDFPGRYAEALGRVDLLPTFRARFSPSPNP